MDEGVKWKKEWKHGKANAVTLQAIWMYKTKFPFRTVVKLYVSTN